MYILLINFLAKAINKYELKMIDFLTGRMKNNSCGCILNTAFIFFIAMYLHVVRALTQYLGYMYFDFFKV